MRKPLLIALIAATALVPVMASAQDWQGRRGGREGGDGAPRTERPRGDDGVRGGGGFEGRGRMDRVQTSAAPPPTPQVEVAPRRDEPRSRPGFGDAQADVQRARRQNDGNGRTEPRSRPGFGDARADYDRARRWDRDAGPDRVAQPPQARDDRRDRPVQTSRPNQGWSGDGRTDARSGWNDNRGARGRDWSRNDRDRGNWAGSNWDRRDDRFSGQGWNRGWRGDNRYDWQSWRQRNRQAYRLPRYYAPQGYHYGYQRFSIGLTLGSMLYSRNYWIDDPWQYRLPEIYGPYRWVRYYNDAVMVDVYTGEVVDVIYDIFW